MLVNDTFAQRPSILPDLNFTFYPIPDFDDAGKACKYASTKPAFCTCDDIEACAVDVLGCTSGCSGDAARKLMGFIACFEGVRNPSQGGPYPPPDLDPARLLNCSMDAPFVQGMKVCLADTNRVLELHHRTKDVADARNIHTTPTMMINGVGSAITAPIATPDDVLKHLCQAGLAAAC